MSNSNRCPDQDKIPQGLLWLVAIAFLALTPNAAFGQDEAATESASSVADDSTTESASSAAAVEGASVVDSTKVEPQNKQAPRKVMFGTYRLRLSVNKPKFGDELKFYDDLYGPPKNYGMIGADWFAWDWFVTFGLGLRTGFYSASGKRIKGGSVNRANPDPAGFEKTGKADLTIIPTQALLTMEFSPFQRKWLVIDGWFGGEYAYWQEVRVEETATSVKSAVFAAAAATDEGNLVNKGFASGTVMGLAVNILLNPLDDRSAKSMENTMGLGSVYLSPFMEIVTGTGNKGMNFGRSVYGIGFTFESIK